jgi:hypothetical protein
MSARGLAFANAHLPVGAMRLRGNCTQGALGAWLPEPAFGDTPRASFSARQAVAIIPEQALCVRPGERCWATGVAISGRVTDERG